MARAPRGRALQARSPPRVFVADADAVAVAVADVVVLGSRLPDRDRRSRVAGFAVLWPCCARSACAGPVATAPGRSAHDLDVAAAFPVTVREPHRLVRRLRRHLAVVTLA
jgi:hypothetical protein